MLSFASNLVGNQWCISSDSAKGIHVFVPLTPIVGWAEVTDFAHCFASALAGVNPERYRRLLRYI